MDLFYVLLILLITTRAFGELAERLRQPSLVGELLAGIALGALVAAYPETFPAFVGLHDSEVFVTITDLGMFFLMLFAGLEMQPHKIVENAKSAIAVACGGMVVPLALGIAVGWVFLPEGDLRFAQCLFLGVVLAITAVPATVRILMDLGQFHTKVGQTIISAAVFDDILSLVLLAWLTALMSLGGPPAALEIVFLIAKIATFFAATAVIGLLVFPLLERSMPYFREQEFEISAVFVSALGFAVLAELLGLHFIVGAFVAGLYFGRKPIGGARFERIRSTTSAMTFGFLAPIFFASIGLDLNLTALFEAPVFVLVVVAMAFFGKMAGAGGAAKMIGTSNRNALAIGVGMSPRGAVELVIAGIALKAGLFAEAPPGDAVVGNMFSTVVIMAVVTTVLSPIILEKIFAAKPDGD